MSAHNRGIDVLGAQPDRVVIIRINDPLALARAQGSAAKLAADWIPDTVKSKVYQTVAERIGDSLRKESVDATVSVGDGAAFETVASDKPTDAAALMKGAILGAGTLSAGYILFNRFFKSGR